MLYYWNVTGERKGQAIIINQYQVCMKNYQDQSKCDSIERFYGDLRVKTMQEKAMEFL